MYATWNNPNTGELQSVESEELSLNEAIRIAREFGGFCSLHLYAGTEEDCWNGALPVSAAFSVEDTFLVVPF